MCTLMALYRRHPEFWLVVAANRDERLDRPSAGPDVLRHDPRAVGGRDLAAGGTWLGVNEHGLFAAVTNRRDSILKTERRSRGLLVRDALAYATVEEAQRYVVENGPQHNPFNLLLLHVEAGALFICNGTSVCVRPVVPGALVITNGDPNERMPSIQRGLRVLRQLVQGSEEDLICHLARTCADHTQDDPQHPPFCLHQPPFGTVSSTILLLRADGTGRYLFAPGPPCTTSYQDVSPLLATLRARPSQRSDAMCPSTKTSGRDR